MARGSLLALPYPAPMGPRYRPSSVEIIYDPEDGHVCL